MFHYPGLLGTESDRFEPIRKPLSTFPYRVISEPTPVILCMNPVRGSKRLPDHLEFPIEERNGSA